MFSITVRAIPLSLQSMLPREQAPEVRAPSLSLGWPAVDAILPDGGLPRGVVEVASHRALGGPTRLAARAIAAAHAKDARGFSAWIDPEATLHAPGLARVGVDLARLFVVRPSRTEVGRIAVKVARAGAFDVIVVDMADMSRACEAWPPPYPLPRGAAPSSERARRPLPPEVVVRKLALAAEEGEATVILLTDSAEARSAQWPVALRPDVERRPDAMGIRIAKDQRGRGNMTRTWVSMAALTPGLASTSPPAAHVHPAPSSAVRIVSA